MPLSPEEVDADERRELGRRAALIASKIDGQEVAEKSYGETSPENYPYTYWWKVGWNDGVKELSDAPVQAK